MPETNAGLDAVERGSGNVFADLGLANPEDRLAKAELARIIRHLVAERGWSQKHAAEVLRIAASDMSDLMRGKLARFSQERLEAFLNLLDMEIEIRVRPKAASTQRASVRVELVEAA